MKEEIEVSYKSEVQKYESNLCNYNEEIGLLESMHNRVKLLPITNENQKVFITNIEPYFSFRKKEIDDDYEKRLHKPFKESIDQATQRLINDKVDDLNRELERLRLCLLFDDEFFKEISEQWFNSTSKNFG